MYLHDRLKKMHKSTIILLLIVLIISTIIGIHFYKNHKELSVEKTKMEQYLKEEYGKEFVIDKIHYYHQYIGAPSEIEGIVHPKDDNELKFDIAKFVDGRKYANGEIYAEAYLDRLWTQQTKQKCKDIFNNSLITTEVAEPSNVINKVPNGRTLNIDEATNLCKNEIILYITCGIFIDSKNKCLDENQLEKFYSALNSLKDSNYKYISLEIRCFDKKHKKEVEKNPDKFLNEEGLNYKELKEKGIVFYKIQIDNIRDIKQPDDILNYIEK